MGASVAMAVAVAGATALVANEAGATVLVANEAAATARVATVAAAAPTVARAAPGRSLDPRRNDFAPGVPIAPRRSTPFPNSTVRSPSRWSKEASPLFEPPSRSRTPRRRLPARRRSRSAPFWPSPNVSCPSCRPPNGATGPMPHWPISTNSTCGISVRSSWPLIRPRRTKKPAPSPSSSRPASMPASNAIRQPGWSNSPRPSRVDARFVPCASAPARSRPGRRFRLNSPPS